MSNFDHSRYRELGNGESVTPADYLLTTDHGPITVPNHLIGTLVMAATEEVFLREVAQPKDSAGMVQFPTGSLRENKQGKGRFDLLPFEGLLALAVHFERGAEKHGPKNWELGQPLSNFLFPMRRHSMQINWDFREDHAAATAWNALAFITTVERIRAGRLPKSLDDIGFFINEEAGK